MGIFPGGRCGGGQQVEHKHTCLPHPLHLPSWGCRAEGPISGPSEPCNRLCQTQLPVEHAGLTVQTVCEGSGAGWPAGWVAAAAGGKHGACQTAASLSPGGGPRPAGRTRCSQASESICSQVIRGHHTSVVAEEGAWQTVLSAFKLRLLTCCSFMSNSMFQHLWLNFFFVII